MRQQETKATLFIFAALLERALKSLPKSVSFWRGTLFEGQSLLENVLNNLQNQQVHQSEALWRVKA